MSKKKFSFLSVLLGLLLAACGGAITVQAPDSIDQTPATQAQQQEQDSFDMVTLLPPDAIPSIDDPDYYPVDQANQEYDPEETVIGLEIEGEARAYSTALLSRHEIVNDVIKGRPIAVTW